MSLESPKYLRGVYMDVYVFKNDLMITETVSVNQIIIGPRHTGLVDLNGVPP
jgi:hypothetical protein